MKNGKSIGNKITSVDGFKRFLETYQRHLHQELSLPPLKIAKALHAAAAALGFSSWQALRAALGEAEQGKSDESGGNFYILTFHDQPRGEEISLAMVGPKRFQCAADCLDTLMGYVLSRVGGGFGELLAPELGSLMDEWVPDEEERLDEVQNGEFWDALVARLDWSDRARIEQMGTGRASAALSAMR